MTKEVPAIFMQDPKTGENVYVVSHVDYVDGMPDDFENYDLDGLQDNVSTINNSLGSVQSQIDSVSYQINDIATIRSNVASIKADVDNMKLQISKLQQQINAMNTKGGK